MPFIDAITNNAKTFLIGEGVMAIVLLVFFLWPGVTYETRTGRPFWFDRVVESLGQLSLNGARRSKVIFIVSAIAAVALYFYGAYANSHADTVAGNAGWLSGWHLMTVLSLGAVSLIAFLFLLFCRFIIHANMVQYTLPGARIGVISSIVGVLYGGYALCNRPGVPDGILGNMISKAFKMELKDRDTAWITSVNLADIGTYVNAFFVGNAWMLVIVLIAAVVTYEVILRHAWIYSKPVCRRGAYPVMCVCLSLLTLQAGYTFGFVAFGYAFVLLCYLISLVIAIVICWIVLKVMISGGMEALSGGGSSSSSGSTSSSCSGNSHSSADTSEGEVTTTYTDSHDREYVGKGEHPDTIERTTPGDGGTFDHHNDGSITGYWENRYTGEKLKEDWP